MGHSSGKNRIFRNPSGRSGRIAPEIRSGDGSSVSIAQPPPIAPPAIATQTKLDQDFSWAAVTGSLRREHAVEGLLLGVAIGESLGLGRGGLRRRSSLRMLGRGPINYAVIPGIGLSGYDTQRMLIIMQSILRSRSQLEGFRKGFANRLRLHLLTLPLYAGRTNLLASLRLCLGASHEQSGVVSIENSPLASAIAIACVLQGTGHSAEKWVALSTETTHVSGETVESAVLMARSAHLAVMTPETDFNPVSIIERLIKITEDQEIATLLKQLREGLLLGKSSSEMAAHLGWQKAIPSSAIPTALMGLYAWLTNHKSFEKTVEQAILLGGDSASLGAVAGGLAAIHLGPQSIPDRWRKWYFGWPNTSSWLKAMANRFVDWPHGVEDLHAAPALPSRPAMQWIRSMLVNFSLAANAVIRLPWKCFGYIFGS